MFPPASASAAPSPPRGLPPLPPATQVLPWERLAVLLSCALSCLGCALLVATHALWPELRTRARQLLLYLSLADLLSAAAYFYGALRDYTAPSWDCVAQGAASTFANTSSFFWTMAIALYLYLTIVRRAPRSRGALLVALFHVVSWGVPFLITAAAVSLKKIGYDASDVSVGWCWIDINAEDRVLWMLLAGKMWEFLAYVTLPIFYLLIKKHVNRAHTALSEYRPLLSRTPAFQLRTSVADKKLILIPVIFIFLRMWSTIRFVLTICNSPAVQNPLLVILHHLTGMLFLTTLISAAGSSLQYGYNYSVINYVSEHIKNFYNETYQERNRINIDQSLLKFRWGLTVSFFPLGGFIGSLLVGPMADGWGRKYSLVANNVLVITSAFLMGLSKSIGSHEFLIMARLFIGMCAGVAFNVVPMYITEVAPTNLRPAFGMIAYLFIIFGGLLANFFTLPQTFGNPRDWPISLAFIAVPALFQLITLPFLPESPRYLLIQRKQEEKARQALKLLRNQNDVEQEIEELRQEDAAEKDEKDMEVVKLLQYEGLQWHVITSIILMGGQQLSGINAAQYYMERIFLSMGIEDTAMPFVTIIIYILLLFTVALTMCMVETYGLKNVLLTGFGMCSITCILLTLSLEIQRKVFWMSYFSGTFVSLFLAGQSIGPDSVSSVIISELFLQSSRSSAFVITGCVHWLFRFLIAIVYLHVETTIEPYSFLFFWPLCVASLIYLSMMIPDTRNKTFLEIRRLVDIQMTRNILIRELGGASSDS